MKEKIKYNTREEAEEHLKHIVETNRKPWKTKDNKKAYKMLF